MRRMKVTLMVMAVALLFAASSATKYIGEEEIATPVVVEEIESRLEPRSCRFKYQVTRVGYGRCQTTGLGLCVSDDMVMFSKDCGFPPMLSSPRLFQ